MFLQPENAQQKPFQGFSLNEPFKETARLVVFSATACVFQQHDQLQVGFWGNRRSILFSDLPGSSSTRFERAICIILGLSNTLPR